MGLVAPAQAQVPPDYGIEWRTIGAPGNRLPNEQESPLSYLIPGEQPYGSVSYEYRLSRTEVTTAQWFEFVTAYAPYYTGSSNDPRFTSYWISDVIGGPGDPVTYTMDPGTANIPAQMSWRFAARYCNWLHNNKASAQWAFETGAYDTSTFTQNPPPDGSYNDQAAHSPDAKFWLPTRHEWNKGMYYDPAKNGGAGGEGGYWMYPTMSDTPPTPGFPWDGGQTSADIGDLSAWTLPVGSYPNVQSPWGLLDGSGSAREWGEDGFAGQPIRSLFGSGANTHPEQDRLDYTGFNLLSGISGIRLASTVPNPSGITGVVLVVCMTLWRKRRDNDEDRLRVCDYVSEPACP